MDSRSTRRYEPQDRTSSSQLPGAELAPPLDQMNETAQGPAQTSHNNPINKNSSGQRNFGSPSKNNLPLKKLLTVAGIIGLLVATGLIIDSLSDRAALSIVKDKQYQAVFLTNGQVYFGKINSIGDNYLTLNDIYYLQVPENEQPQAKESSKTPEPAAQDTALAKLGRSELHGPEDTMYIERGQILFWENMKSDSKVAKAIVQDKQAQKTP